MFSRRLPAERYTIDCDITELPFMEAARVCQEYNFAVLKNVFSTPALEAIRYDTALHLFRQEKRGLLNGRRTQREVVEWTAEHVAVPSRRSRPYPWLSAGSVVNIGRIAGSMNAYADQYPRIALQNPSVAGAYAVRYPHEGFVRNHQDRRTGLIAEIALAGQLMATVAEAMRPTRPVAKCILDMNDVLIMPGIVEGFQSQEHRVYHELRNITENEPLHSNRQISLVVRFEGDISPPESAAS